MCYWAMSEITLSSLGCAIGCSSFCCAIKPLITYIMLCVILLKMGLGHIYDSVESPLLLTMFCLSTEESGSCNLGYIINGIYTHCCHLM